MRLGIYTDPHLGKHLTANTTPSSRERMKQGLYIHTQNCIKEMDADAVICAGDLLDTYANDETTLLQALDIVRHTDLTLAGNHDIHSNKVSVGTLDVLATFHPEEIVRTPFGESFFAVNEVDEYVIVSVPHHTTQELFEVSLRNAAKQVAGKAQTKILIAHCNYDCPFAKEETSLNLSKQMTAKLLNSFDYIVLGHDHNHKMDFGGRLIVLGNTHPTGFGDINDKHILLFDGGNPELRSVWDSDTYYLEITPEQLDRVDPGIHQFVRIVGTVKPSEVSKLAKGIKQLWASKDCDIFAIRSEVKIEMGNVHGAEIAQSDGQRLKLTDIVEAELSENKELLELWKEVSA